MVRRVHGGWAYEHRKNLIKNMRSLFMDAVTYLYIFIILALILLAYIFYVLLSKMGRKDKIREEFRRIFNAEDYGEALKFQYRGYLFLVTFRPDVKVSISHNKDVENVKNVPKGMKLTPMFLIIKIKKADEIKKRIDEGVEFLSSIPTQ